MQDIKKSGGEHREHAIDTSSNNSYINNNDLEKRVTSSSSRGLGPREDDAVTAKTWAVVVVSYSRLYDLLSNYI
jgi:hypothetical protein